MKVLIVDDELLIVRGIQYILETSDFSPEAIETTTSSMEAITIAETFRPDIILSDIRMPDLNGLKMIEKIQRVKPDTKIVFVSSYDDFDFLREAIHLGSSDYLLKPVNKIELISTLKKLSQEIKLEKIKNGTQRSDKKLLQENFLRRMLHQELNPVEQQQADTLISDLRGWKSYGLLSLKSNLFHENKLQKVMNSIKELFISEIDFLMSSTQMVVIYDASHLPKDQNIIEELLVPYNLTGVISFKVQEISSLHEVNQLCDWLLEQEYFFEERPLLTLAQATLGQIEIISQRNLVIEIEKCVARQNFVQLRQICSQLDVSINTLQGSLLKNFILLGVFKGIHIILESSLTKENFYDRVSDLLFFLELSKGTVKDHSQELINLVEQIIFENSSSYSPVVCQIIYLLESNLSEKYSLKQLADKFHMNSAYLGQLFQKDVGESFSRFYQKLKMDVANKQIKNSEERISIIAKKLGYEDISNFYRHYKKEFGVTPNKARRS